MRSPLYSIAIIKTALSREVFKLKDVESSYNKLGINISIGYRTKHRILNGFAERGILKKVSRNRYSATDKIKEFFNLNE